ncbi:hypothetical protein [Rhodococcus sp. KB6]|uniref:hypothetical protein n=1 Tax=Rhodococcus sp. KB6 TaxID=1752066 RepID=UPI00071815D5|nr:hypothetical protein [Rhodococcus sp. KB6]
MSAQPLIEEARVKFTGLSAESFEEKEIGTKVTFTIAGTVSGHSQSQQSHEGMRRVQTIKVDRVLTGVDHAIDDVEEEQPSLYDTPSESEPDDETSSNVSDFTGPTFSSDD